VIRYHSHDAVDARKGRKSHFDLAALDGLAVAMVFASPQNSLFGAVKSALYPFWMFRKFKPSAPS
jgi:hypothetical protein